MVVGLRRRVGDHEQYDIYAGENEQIPAAKSHDGILFGPVERRKGPGEKLVAIE
jgi:hypothetical protein